MGKLIGNIEIIPRIYVIESPSDIDRLQGRNEGRALIEGLKHTTKQTRYYDVASKEAFDLAIQDIIEDSRINTGLVRVYKNLQTGESKEELIEPMIHFSCHGNSEGISLTNKSFIRWEELHAKFEFMDKVSATPNVFQMLILSLSSCHGMSFINFLKDCKGNKRYTAVIAPNRKIGWDEGYIFYSSLFRHMTRQTNVGTAERSLILEALKYCNLNINFGEDLPFHAIGKLGKIQNGINSF